MLRELVRRADVLVRDLFLTPFSSQALTWFHAGGELRTGYAGARHSTVRQLTPTLAFAGKLAEMGFSYEHCKALNPRLIYASISGSSASPLLLLTLADAFRG